MKPFAYPKGYFVRRVSVGGQIAFRGDMCRVGRAFQGLEVGVQVVDAMRIRVWLHDFDLGLVETLPAVDPACFELPTRKRRSAGNDVVSTRPRGPSRSDETSSSPA